MEAVAEEDLPAERPVGGARAPRALRPPMSWGAGGGRRLWAGRRIRPGYRVLVSTTPEPAAHGSGPDPSPPGLATASPAAADGASPAAATAVAVCSLRLFDTATGTVRLLELRDPGRVGMYVCGPTVYDVPHLGHGRFSLVFDVLRRYLRFCGLQVRYVSNITDVDDKILDRAAREGRTPSEVAGEFEAVWWRAMDALGVGRPDETPHATAWVEAMVAMVADLVGRGVAYETDDGVYLDVEQVPGYGLLALQPLDSLRAGARVESSVEKRSPLDFALWKKVAVIPSGAAGAGGVLAGAPGVSGAAGDASAGVPGSAGAGGSEGAGAGAGAGELWWPSPWGPGRPGWHTECVVMSLGLLGDGFDLHGGGQDLRFPHHENERAQAVAAGRTFAQHWAHNGFVEVDGEKMSKSLGNFTSLTDLLAQADGRAYRLLVLRSHYRKPIEVNPATVADAEEGLARLDGIARRFPAAAAAGAAATTADRALAAGADPEAVAAFRMAMDDDLDTGGALAGVFELVRRANAAGDAGQEAEAERAAATVAALAGALGLALRATVDEVDAATAALVAQRDAARAAKDWARADAVRDELVARGWIVEDGPSGTAVRRKAPSR